MSKLVKYRVKVLRMVYLANIMFYLIISNLISGKVLLLFLDQSSSSNCSCCSRVVAVVVVPFKCTFLHVDKSVKKNEAHHLVCAHMFTSIQCAGEDIGFLE